MKILRAEIKNFRSISDLTIAFDPKCRILIGINESGKSNILRALHLLDREVKVSPADLRIERLDEPEVTSGWVRFVFELSDVENATLASDLLANIEKGSVDKPLIHTDSGSLTAREWAEKRYQGVYTIAIPSGVRQATSWAYPNSTKILSGWVRNKSTETIELQNGESKVTLDPSCFMRLDAKTTPLPDQLEEATIAQLYSIVYDKTGKLLKASLPKCIFWKYSDQYLLPSSIDISTFCQDPNSCIPLKSMFELAGYDTSKLLDTINGARQQGQHRYSQVLEKTANAATKHIRTVWRDYGTVQFKIQPNGDALSPMILDEQVPLDMANRSDGFKRFVSFLLQISAKVRTEELNDALILVDEPEIALHPSGCKHLLDELIKIGDTNALVFSTHSIFMIDKEKIERHLVVEKKNEITTTWKADISRIQDEEVLYSAMGYSVFETLKSKNVIFEGWRDKQIYQIAKDSISKNEVQLKTRLAAIGITHATGVKDIRNVAKFMELADRSCLIISDADEPALQHRRQYLEPASWGEWKTLKDIYGATPVVTAEDLITKAAVIKRANKFRPTIAGLAALEEEAFVDGEPYMDILSNWLRGAGLDGQNLAKAKEGLKSALFDNLKRSEVKDLAERLVRYVDEYQFE